MKVHGLFANVFSLPSPFRGEENSLNMPFGSVGSPTFCPKANRKVNEEHVSGFVQATKQTRLLEKVSKQKERHQH